MCFLFIESIISIYSSNGYIKKLPIISRGRTMVDNYVWGVGNDLLLQLLKLCPGGRMMVDNYVKGRSDHRC